VKFRRRGSACTIFNRASVNQTISIKRVKMKSSRVFVLLLLLVQLLLIAEVCGLSLSISGGDGSGTVGSTTKITAPTDGSVESVAFLTSGHLSQSISGSGDLGAQSHGVSNRDGSEAAVYVMVDKAASYQYDYSLYPGEGSGYPSKYVKASETLTATNAEEISASATANNAKEDHSEVSVRIQHGSIDNYKNSAYADKSNAKSSQKAYMASGNQIEFYQHASNGRGYDVEADVYVQGSTTPSSLKSYMDSADATGASAALSRDIGFLSGDVISCSTEASNTEDGTKVIDGQEISYIENGEMDGYSSSAGAKKSRLTSSQDFKSAFGQQVTITGNAYTSGFDGSAIANLNLESGSIKRYTGLVSAKTGSALSAFSSQSFDSANADVISVEPIAYKTNLEGSVIYSEITGGSLSRYSDDSIVDGAKSKVSANINAKGSSIDVQSLAENSRVADEYLAYVDGTVVNYLVTPGWAEFEFQTHDRMNAKVTSQADSNNVIISPTLPKGTPTAIILEPMYGVFTYLCGGTDLGTTAFPSMVDKGYAVLRYTDSGATKDKFMNLYKYNVALIISHMNSDLIALSTGTGKSSLVSYDELNYKKPPAKSLIILGGCESFMPDGNSPSNLAKAVSKADLRGGYSTSVYTVWDQDYISRIFDNMATGMTFSDAESEAWTDYRLTWCDYYGVSYTDQYVARLSTYGKGGFTL
jgi:hypothetical protein